MKVCSVRHGSNLNGVRKVGQQKNQPLANMTAFKCPDRKRSRLVDGTHSRLSLNR